MAMTPEKKVKKAVSNILDMYGVYYFSPVTGGFGRSGVPDIVACFKSKFIAIECKAGTNQPTELQKREIAKIQNHGGSAIVVNEQTLYLVEDVLKHVIGELK
jgi:Holliday junction resolvase